MAKKAQKTRLNKDTGITVNSGNIVAIFEKIKEDLNKADIYTATIISLGKKVSTTGSTIKEAIENLKPINTKSVAILVIEKNGYKQERILQPNQVYRLFNGGKLMKELALKNISMLFT